MQKSINYNRRQTTKRRDRKKIDAPPFDPISPPRTTNSDVRDIYRVVYQNPFNFRAARVSTRNEQDRYLSPQPLRKKYFSEIFSSTVYIFRPPLPTCHEGRFFFHKNSSIFPQHFDKTFTLEKYPKRYVLRAWDRCNVVPCPWNCSFFPSVFTRKKKKRIANRRSSTYLRFLFSSMKQISHACLSFNPMRNKGKRTNLDRVFTAYSQAF